MSRIIINYCDNFAIEDCQSAIETQNWQLDSVSEVSGIEVARIIKPTDSNPADINTVISTVNSFATWDGQCETQTIE